MYTVCLCVQCVVLSWAAEMKGSLVDSVSQCRHCQHHCSEVKNVSALSVYAKASLHCAGLNDRTVFTSPLWPGGGGGGGRGGALDYKD